jgi:CRISPR/Cas system CSM-associated protein Csm3 (group 7 of RAMP superfamily)
MTERDRDGDRGAPLPKPYAFVPLPAGRPRLEAPAGHHRYHAGRYSGTLSATILARSPVHVASGLLEPTRDRQHPLVKGLFRSRGVPVIPGTSLKGCARAIVEAISGSAVQVTRARDLPREQLPPRSVERLDPAQRIFGALGYQGAFAFADAPLAEGRTEIVETPQLFRPRPESHDTYFDGRTPRGRKFYMHGEPARGDLPLEACAAGSRFTLRASFSNLSAAELGLALAGLGLGEPRWWPKLGGAKPACLGTIEVLDAALTAFAGAGGYGDFDAAPAPLEVAPLIEAAREARLLLSEPAARLAEILRWPREDRACPDGSY